MKAKNIIIGNFILGIGLALAGCVSTEGFHEESLSQFKQLDSVGHHAQVHESPEFRIARLEDKIMNLQERIAVFNKKQYFDPHEFRLSGWQILNREYQKEIKKLRKKLSILKMQFLNMRV